MCLFMCFSLVIGTIHINTRTFRKPKVTQIASKNNIHPCSYTNNSSLQHFGLIANIGFMCKSLKKNLLDYLLLFYVLECFACMYLCSPHAW